MPTQKQRKLLSLQHLLFLQSAGNLKSFSVRSKIYSFKRKVGSARYNRKRCQDCLNIKETDTFESFQTKQKYKINHVYLNCNVESLIYLLSCKVCGLHYQSSSTDTFRFCWNNYKENESKAQVRRNIFGQNFPPEKGF